MAKIGGAPLMQIADFGEMEVCTIFVTTNIDPINCIQHDKGMKCRYSRAANRAK